MMKQATIKHSSVCLIFMFLTFITVNFKELPNCENTITQVESKQKMDHFNGVNLYSSLTELQRKKLKQLSIERHVSSQVHIKMMT